MRYQLLKANPLKESSRDFLAWLSELPKSHKGDYKLVTTATARILETGIEIPEQFIGTELQALAT